SHAGGQEELVEKWEGILQRRIHIKASGGAVQTCQQSLPPRRAQGTGQTPTKHWIHIRLVKLPDQSKRPHWWPVEGKQTYPNEPFVADITDGRKVAALSGSAETRYDGIPAGACSIKFNAFYAAIETKFKSSGLDTTGSPSPKDKKLVITGIDSHFAAGLEDL